MGQIGWRDNHRIFSLSGNAPLGVGGAGFARRPATTIRAGGKTRRTSRRGPGAFRAAMNAPSSNVPWSVTFAPATVRA